MEPIKISKESLEAFKNGLHLALINGKDVAEPIDWLDDVLDEFACNPSNDKQFVGYIGDDIIEMKYNCYEITWRVVRGSSSTAIAIEERAGIKPDCSESPHLITKFERIGRNLIQRFYWED